MPCTIGRAAEESGVSAKMIRHYESLRLLRPDRRGSSGYRIYAEADIHTLRFIRRARDLGFSIRQIEELLGLWRNRRRASSEVRRVARQHLEELQQKIQELERMRRALESLVEHCHGDSRPECPILDDLAAPVARQEDGHGHSTGH